MWPCASFYGLAEEYLCEKQCPLPGQVTSLVGAVAFLSLKARRASRGGAVYLLRMDWLAEHDPPSLTELP